ncbi:4-hydroxybenzoate octaprenyltransferase [Rhodoplanes sp. TEM]|uniref:4-hydroxybenzoate octaprenyltransferase n=1 Tax=Rhodoplanes tepidamans TaxID=200616 RepID=A0ABT5J5C6_RHOTP|nr:MULTISPECIES: 4-hydroxybenzoate octaprenyltransferase [Rhodoplanes]MDC7784519.1 4-hydroxybenzoate octaprenyltransferase [Rhodoplanes tepidamans]MDC7984426.1 4-hydroxybenzoate octaprenyltransferase [Rhodoplanes sp. TEM]MDQ0355747.1 4-hydroxybenzoate polyprenyltransferase [Rhodoplanes tepidamans]
MNTFQGRIADSVGNWVDRNAPSAVKPYLRLSRFDRPIGAWLLLIPCWWSAALAAVAAGQPLPNVWHLILFFVGAFVMRGAGCTWNDIADHDIDKKVERTRLRPIASGAVTLSQALAYAILQSLVGFLVLVQFNGFAIATGIASLGIVALYPFMKRVTYWPQIVLGLAFSWGALMGWAGAFGRLDVAPILLYLGAIAWVIGYDTIYAHQDRADDLFAGIKSTALLFGERTRSMLTWLYGAAVVLIGLAGLAAGGGFWFAAGLAAFAIHLGWQVTTLDIEDTDRCLMQFRSNRDAGLLLFAGMVLDAML